MKRFLIYILLAILTVVSSVFTACDSNNHENGHVHEYVYGVCSCGDEIENYYTPGLVFEKNAAGTEYAVTGYDKSSATVIIPESYDNLPVTAIGDEAFINCNKLGRITIPKSVTSIGEYAFWGCGLLGVTLPENLKTISIGAFNDCVKLKEINYNAILLDDVTQEGVFNNAGSSGEGITVTIGRAVEAIPSFLFCHPQLANRANITSVVFEDNGECEKIGQQAFYDLRCVESFSFGANSKIESVDYCAFGNMGYGTNFSSLTVPASVRMIDKYAFSFPKQAGKSAVTIEFEDVNGWYYTPDAAKYQSKAGGMAADLSLLTDDSTDIYSLCGGKNYLYKT